MRQVRRLLCHRIQVAARPLSLDEVLEHQMVAAYLNLSRRIMLQNKYNCKLLLKLWQDLRLHNEYQTIQGRLTSRVYSKRIDQSSAKDFKYLSCQRQPNKNLQAINSKVCFHLVKLKEIFRSMDSKQYSTTEIAPNKAWRDKWLDKPLDKQLTHSISNIEGQLLEILVYSTETDSRVKYVSFNSSKPNKNK